MVAKVRVKEYLPYTIDRRQDLRFKLAKSIHGIRVREYLVPNATSSSPITSKLWRSAKTKPPKKKLSKIRHQYVYTIYLFEEEIILTLLVHPLLNRRSIGSGAWSAVLFSSEERAA